MPSLVGQHSPMRPKSLHFGLAEQVVLPPLLLILVVLLLDDFVEDDGVVSLEACLVGDGAGNVGVVGIGGSSSSTFILVEVCTGAAVLTLV